MLKSFATLCSDLAYAHREWHLQPTEANRAKALLALAELNARSLATWRIRDIPDENI